MTCLLPPTMDIRCDHCKRFLGTFRGVPGARGEWWCRDCKKMTSRTR